MTSASEKNDNMVLTALKSNGFDQTYDIERLLMSTRLYSVYLISEKEQTRPKDSVLLLEHPPAKEPSAHLLPVKFRESASKNEQLQKIVEAVQDYYAERGSI